MKKTNLEQAYKELNEAYKILKEELGLLTGKKEEQNLKGDTMFTIMTKRSNFSYVYNIKGH